MRKCVLSKTKETKDIFNMWFTFEMLPDEILMVMIRYSGNIYSTFGVFSDLNQRINNILIDKCMIRSLVYDDLAFISSNQDH